jgi:acyl-coenzyme A synthetase/AMP-(fatty) acid ligase
VTWLNAHIQELNEKKAITDQFGSFSYAQLHQQTLQYKSLLDQSVADCQVVTILSDYNFYSVALFLALLEKKTVIVPIASAKSEEIERRLNVVSSHAIIRLDKDLLSVDHNSNVKLHTMVQSLVVSKQAGLVLFSSGSTGEPKAMIHNLDNLVNSYQGKKIKNLNILVFLMFDHIGGLNTLLNTLAMGARIILPVNRNPEYIASLIEEYQVHVLPTSPTFLNMMLMAKVQDKYNLKSLKMITYGTEPMLESLLLKLKSALPKTKLLQTFGTSETGITQTSSRSSGSLEMKLDGTNTQYKIVEGELWLKSKTQVMGYLNASMESFSKDGWFKTGDLVEELAGGYLRIKGRAKEVINVGGEKVLPTEVESIVLEVEGVADCTAYGAKNAIIGQMVAVQVVLEDGVDKKEAKILIRKHCKQKLDSYKIPAKFEFVEQTDFSERFKKKRISE